MASLVKRPGAVTPCGAGPRRNKMQIKSDFTPTPYEHTAFGGFWKAINLHLTRIGLPELGFKDARDAWDAAVSVAGQIIREHGAKGTTSARSAL
jgi:hypothetical protein